MRDHEEIETFSDFPSSIRIFGDFQNWIIIKEDEEVHCNLVSRFCPFMCGDIMEAYSQVTVTNIRL